MRVERLDHLVLTVEDIDRTLAFYARVLGLRHIEFAGGRTALAFGDLKINLHQGGGEVEPKARHPVPGSADLCLVSATPPGEVVEHLRRCGVEVELGPVARTGALGPIESVYFRDPDGNLLEVSSYGDRGTPAS